MPARPLKQCNVPGCRELSNSPKCPVHSKKARAKWDENRKTATERGYDHTWHKVRTMKANLDPLCQYHLRRNIIIPLDLVHHIHPIEDYPEMRLMLDNLYSLCKQCHDDPEIVKELFNEAQEKGLPLI